LTIATAIVYFHRFFVRKDFSEFDRWVCANLPLPLSPDLHFPSSPLQLIATACLFLAGKVEETPKKLKDVLLVTYKLRNKKDIVLDSSEYYSLREEILIQERCVLQTIAFDLTVDHPYKHVIDIIKSYHIPKEKGGQELAQYAWNFVNDRFAFFFSLSLSEML